MKEFDIELHKVNRALRRIERLRYAQGFLLPEQKASREELRKIKRSLKRKLDKE